MTNNTNGNNAKVINFDEYFEKKHLSPITTREIITDYNTGRKYLIYTNKYGKCVKIPVQPHNTADDPIRDIADVRRLEEYLRNRKGHKLTVARDYAYFIFSINMWRRAGDTLNLRICDVLNANGDFKTHLEIKEGKTGKPSRTYINERVKSVLEEYLNVYKYKSMNDYLFPNFNPKYDAEGKEMPLEVQAMRRMLQRAAKAIGLTDVHIGTHSLRKTGTYHAAQLAETPAELNIISQALRHSSFKVTQTYIGETQKRQDEFMKKCIL